ncbi:ribonuclease III domain-containing protein [Russula ochroleuca]|uniref:Ribonuclease III domain-containing protein n=1 Tax=Russula ochroleuca TaxID=152965 RepID=A0A9P5MRR7_9AGAM|nr:ribonuclease III domain-containing protein [Russula ochroleuca]
MSSTEYSSPHSSSKLPSVAIGILPPLPKIRSGQIRKRTFNHGSLAGENKYDFQAPESDPSTDNEELAHIGDQVFGLVVTDLIQNLYPYLRVGRASRLRDHIKRKSIIAEICVSYGLHMKANLPERQADSLRTSQSVQVNIFKAYVGGVYRDQDLGAVRKWLISVIQPHVEAAYQHLRDDYLPKAVALPRVPAASNPSSPSPTSSEGAEPALPSPPAREPGDQQRSLRSRVDGPHQGSRRVDGGVDNHPQDTDQSGSNRRRRRSSQGEGRSGNSGKQGLASPRRHY